MAIYKIDSEQEWFNATEVALIFGFSGYSAFCQAIRRGGHADLVGEKLGDHKNAKYRFHRSDIEEHLNELTKPVGMMHAARVDYFDPDVVAAAVTADEDRLVLVAVDGASWLDAPQTAKALGYPSREAFYMAIKRGKHDLLLAHRNGIRTYAFHVDDVEKHKQELLAAEGAVAHRGTMAAFRN
ncbi:hypothetical protein [Nesterenkonia alba]|uniref:hypothetical protein n=1 Tax=Nesterenkonia alba TaxID=515814 RepID=UPI0003B5BD3B|nr:hypothetical protein [Nesterenkonia alba]